MSQDRDIRKQSVDPALVAALEEMLHEIGNEPVSDRIRELSLRLQSALDAARKTRRPD